MDFLPIDTIAQYIAQHIKIIVEHDISSVHGSLPIKFCHVR